MSATAAQMKTAQYIPNRAPRGGAVSSVNGQWYAGGRYMPALSTEQLAKASSPAPLTGSHAQISWATRLRSSWIARLDAKLAALRGKLATAPRKDGAGIRAEIQRVEGKRFRLWSEWDAATIVGRHVAKGLAASGMGGLRMARRA